MTTIKHHFFTLFFLLYLPLCGVKAQNNCSTYTCYLCSWGGEFKVVIPTIFTPNSDFVNDVWVPMVHNEVCMSDYSVQVFNRWGRLVFESNVYSIGWTGNETEAGIHCPTDVYYYVISYTNHSTGETRKEKGFLQLER